MAICMFLGHRKVYDKNLYRKIADAVFEIAERHDSVTYLFHNLSHGAFYAACYRAALAAKQRYPEKGIALALAVERGELERLAGELGRPGLWTPAQTADRLLALPDPTLGGGDYSIYAKRERWAIRQCTHLVSYLYPALLEPENQQYLYAQNCGLTLYDLTSPDTAAFLAEQAGRLPERQRLALSLRLEGRAQKEAEAALGVRGPAFRRLAQQAAWGLEQAARRRLLGDPAWQAEAPPCCGVFALGPPDYENLSLFEGAVQFVAARYGIRRFYVAAEYCHSGYMKVLKMAAQSLGGCHVTAAAGCQEVTPALEARLAFQFCPPCQEVELILAPAKRPRARDLTVAKALMQRCDFCICDLYGHPMGASLRQQAAKRDGAALLDIGRKNTGAG